MSKYRYQATDAQGKPVSGEVEATGADDARRKLADQGLDAEHAQLTEISERVSGAGRLSADEAVEVGSQLAELAKAGLPLAPGLRAMAEEIRLLMRGETRRLVWLGLLTIGLGAAVLLPFYLASTSRRRRVARALERLADQLDAGTSLSAALESQGRRFPRHVRGLILAGIETGRLPEALEEFVAVEGARIELRRQVWLALAYPCVLLLALAALFILAFTFLVPQFGKVFMEFGAELPFATKVLLWQAGPGFWVVIGVPVLAAAALVCLALSRGAVWLRRMFYAVPLVGPVWRWAGLFNLSRLMALLLGQQVPLPSALRLTATGLREADLAAACREAAEEVEAGRSLSECLAEFWQFPPSLRPLVAWGEQASDPAAAFRAAAEMFDGRVRVGVTMLHAVLPPIVFVLIIAGVFSLIGGLFMPLISLIQNLT